MQQIRVSYIIGKRVISDLVWDQIYNFEMKDFSWGSIRNNEYKFEKSTTHTFTFL